MPEDEEEKETIYDKEGREDQLEDDELSPEEEAFMKGYDEANEEKEDPDSEEEKGDEEEQEEKEE